MANKKYYAEIFREDDASWVIKDIQPGSTPVPADDVTLRNYSSSDRTKRVPQSYPSDITDGVLLAGLFVGDRWLPHIFSHPRFSIDEITSTEVGGKHEVCLTFSAPPKDPNDTIYIQKGKLVLLPDDYWVVSHGEVTVVFWGKEKYKFSLRKQYENQDGVPVITFDELESTDVTHGEVPMYTRSSKFSLHKTTDTSPERFQLSAFGLPEPVFERSSTHLRSTVLVGIVLVALIVFFSSRKAVHAGRRRRNNNSVLPRDE